MNSNHYSLTIVIPNLNIVIPSKARNLLFSGSRENAGAPGLAHFETWESSPTLGRFEYFSTIVIPNFLSIVIPSKARFVIFLNHCHSEQSEESAVVGKPRKCSRTGALRSGLGWRSAFSTAVNADRMTWLYPLR